MLRLDKGLSQFELAERAGISEDQISKIERGKSWVGELTLSQLSDALNVPQSSLFDYSENDAFIKRGGLNIRAPRRVAHLVVRNKGKVVVHVPKKK